MTDRGPTVDHEASTRQVAGYDAAILHHGTRFWIPPEGLVVGRADAM